ncbi:ASCH domain-containing protein [Winogradskyella sediminis]|uniref:ASCH domain-containing protein n=1 Tax=Winogradskyella sediminis TaxID=1382466 RepID=UPI003AA7B353
MRNLICVLLILITACKSETTTRIQQEKSIDKSVYEIWQAYLKSHPELPQDELPESWYFHDNRDDANRLAALVLSRKKKASSGLYTWYKDANADLPKIGTKHIVTNFNGAAKAIIEITKVDTIPFNKIPKSYAALDMGISTNPLQKWKKAHWDFFTSSMVESGETPTEDMLIVCEEFKTIWPEK